MRWPFRKKALDPLQEFSFLRVGFDVANERLTNPYLQNPWVYSGASAKAETLAATPFKLFTGQRGTEEKEPIESSEWQALIDRPSPIYPTWSALTAMASIFLDVHGEAPYVALGSGNGFRPGEVPQEMYLVRPEMLREELNRANAMIERWRFVGAGGDQSVVPPEMLGLVQLSNPLTPFRGLSPLKACSLGIEYDFSAHQYNVALMKNGADPGGIAKIPDAKTWSADKLAAWRQQHEDRHRGAGKGGRVAVWDSTMDYVPIPTTAKGMQFMEARQWSRDEVKACLHVTDWQLGLTQDFSYASAQEATRFFYNVGVIPRASAIQEMLWTWLFKPWSERNGVNVWGEFDFSGVAALRYEFTERLESVAKLAPYYSIASINKRLELGMPDDAIVEQLPALDAEPIVPIVRTVTKAKRDDDDAIVHRAVGQYFAMMRAEVLDAVGTKDLGRVPKIPDGKSVQKKVKSIFDASFEALIKAHQRKLRREGFPVLGIDDAHRKMIERETRRMMKVASNDLDRLRGRLQKTFDEVGFSNVAAVSEAVDEYFKTQYSARGQVIARTETGFIQAQVSRKAFVDEGITRFEWSSSSDDHTRAWHRDMNGEQTEIGKPYSNGLLHPLQPGAPGREVINCRCSEVPLA